MRYRLTPQEQAFIAAIGFLRVPGLFAPDVAAFGSRPGRRLFTMNFRQGLDLVSGR